MNEEIEPVQAYFTKVEYYFEIEHGLCCAHLYNLLDKKWYMYTDMSEPVISNFKEEVETYLNKSLIANVSNGFIVGFEWR